MSNQSLAQRVQEELSRAIESGLLSGNTQKQARILLDRLEQPVRLALLGMPAAGKSAILNLLVGADVVPLGVTLPTLELSYGETEQALCTLPDGTKKAIPTADADQIAQLSPVFVELQMPLPALKKITVLEVSAPADPNAMSRASQWAAKRADIILWCSGGFNDTEQQIWAQMPDTAKDHGFLMVTRKDILETQGIFADLMRGIAEKATPEFNKIIPIATLDAIASRKPNGTVDKDAMRASGGSALISAVLKQVEQGNRSSVDMGEVLLLQNEDVLANVDAVLEAARAIEGPEIAEEPETPEPAPIPEPVVEQAPEPVAKAPAEPVVETPVPPAPNVPDTPVVTDGIARLRAIAERRAAELIEPETPATIQPATREAFEHVIAYLEERGRELSQTLEDTGADAPTEVISLAVEHVQWLCDYLNDNGDDADASLQRARETAFDAADLVQLMQLEKRDSAALEAVILMLQVKRELQADLAA